MKYRIWKLFFAVNLPLKLSPATVANADTGSQYFAHMLVKFEQNCMVQTTRNFELFDTHKKRVLKIIFDKALTPFLKTFL